MKVLIACEFSQVVTEAFTKEGHEVLSCDFFSGEKGLPHYRGDVFDIIDYPWDLAIFHFPCTDTAVSGARYFKEKKQLGKQQASISLFMKGIRRSEHIKKTVFEHPVSIMSTLYRKPDQIIQPWQFGHGETKATCLWLKGLQRLKSTNVVDGRVQRIWKLPPSRDRAKLRSITYQGIANAMAEQWG